MPKIKSTAIALGLAALAIGLSGAPARANLVQNSSFEDDGFNQGSSLFCPMTGWSTTCDGASGATQTLAPGLVGRASYLAIGSTGGLNFVSQDITTAAGQTYRFVFDYSSDGASGNQFQALWDGSLVMNVADDAFNAGWNTFDGSATYEFLVTATSALTTIAFGGLGNGASFIGVDDVSVTAVPAPGAVAVLGFGLGLAGLVRRRRRIAD